MITYALVGAACRRSSASRSSWRSPAVAVGEEHRRRLGSATCQRAISASSCVVALFGIVGLGVGRADPQPDRRGRVGIVFLLVIENILLAIPGVKHVWPYTPGGAVAGDPAHHRQHATSPRRDMLLDPRGGVLVLLLWAFIPAIAGRRVHHEPRHHLRRCGNGTHA